jgi:hypothetical protein
VYVCIWNVVYSTFWINLLMQFYMSYEFYVVLAYEHSVWLSKKTIPYTCWVKFASCWTLITSLGLFLDSQFIPLTNIPMCTPAPHWMDGLPYFTVYSMLERVHSATLFSILRLSYAFGVLCFSERFFCDVLV